MVNQKSLNQTLVPHNAYLKIVHHFNLFQTLVFYEEIENLAY